MSNPQTVPMSGERFVWVVAPVVSRVVDGVAGMNGIGGALAVGVKSSGTYGWPSVSRSSSEELDATSALRGGGTEKMGTWRWCWNERRR